MVLVAGASGRTGSAVLAALRQSDYTIRALTSNRARAVERHGGAWPWVEVDVRDAHAVTAVMSGVDYVISTLGARQREGPMGPEFVDYGGVRNLVDAAQAAGAKHFVLMSSAAAGPYRERSRMIQFGDVRYWKTRGEQHLKASGLPYTIVAASGLESQPPRGTGIRVISRREYDTGLIAISDVAMLLVDALTNPDARNKTFAVLQDDSASQAWRGMLKQLPEDRFTDEAATP